MVTRAHSIADVFDVAGATWALVAPRALSYAGIAARFAAVADLAALLPLDARGLEVRGCSPRLRRRDQQRRGNENDDRTDDTFEQHLLLRTAVQVRLRAIPDRH